MALTDNIVAYYKLDDTSDSVGSRTLTNNNTVTFGAGLIGNAADFGASNTNKSLTNTADNYGWSGGNISISAWVKLTTEITSGNYGILEIGDNTTSKTALIIFYQFNGGSREISIDAHVAGVNDFGASSSLTMGTTNWYHFVITWGGSGTAFLLYVNGTQVATVTPSGTGSGTEDQGFSLGTAPRFGTFLSGKIDEVGIWSRILSSGEVTSLYNGGAGLQYPFTTSTPSVNTALMMGI